MIQIHASKALSADLKPLLAEAPPSPGAMQWYAHRVQVLRRKCVIVMEEQSRYAMVFTGLTKPDFARFPEIFRDRLIREALSICQLDDAQTSQLEELALLVTESVQIMPGSDRSVQTHINEVARDLDWMTHEIGYLPEDDGQEFSFGLRINETPRTRRGEKGYFFPLRRMRDFWLGLLQHTTDQRGKVVPLHGKR